MLAVSFDFYALDGSEFQNSPSEKVVLRPQRRHRPAISSWRCSFSNQFIETRFVLKSFSLKTSNVTIFFRFSSDKFSFTIIPPYVSGADLRGMVTGSPALFGSRHSGQKQKDFSHSELAKIGTRFQISISFYPYHIIGIRELILTFHPTAFARQTGYDCIILKIYF